MTKKKLSANSTPRKPNDPLLTATIGSVVSELGINDWDALIVGDGSGTTWKGACGWSSVLIEHHSMYRRVFKGAWDPGTVGIAELSAYFHALIAYSVGPGKARLHDMMVMKRQDPRLKIHIVTDNETIVKQGEGIFPRKTLGALWAGLTYVEAQGYKLHWHWLKRDRLGLNRLVDHLSRESRKAMDAVQPPQGVTAYDINPTEKDHVPESQSPEAVD